MADNMSSEGNQFKQELEDTIYTNEEEVNIYVRLREEGMAEIGAIEMLNSFGIKELRAIMRFRDFYGHYFQDNDLSIKLSADCSDAIKGLKAVQREAKATVRDLKELELKAKELGLTTMQTAKAIGDNL